MCPKSVLLTLLLLPALSVPCASQTAPSKQDQITQHSRMAQQYLQEKRPEMAIPEFQALVALDPGNADAHGNLGVLLFFRRDFRSEERRVGKECRSRWS